jgi:hypothetical protein
MNTTIYDLYAIALIISGVFGFGYIIRRACHFWKRDRFLAVLDIAWSLTMLYLAVYYFLILTGIVYSAPISQGAYIRPALIFILNIPIVITIARR